MKRADIIKKRSSLKTAASILALAAATLAAGAHAQAQSFDVEAGPAPSALNEFARQAEVSLVYSFDLVGDLRTNAVQGQLEPVDALTAMLDGTGLIAVAGTNGGFAIVLQGDTQGAALITGSGPAASTSSTVVSGVSVQPATGPSGEEDPGVVRGQVTAAGVAGGLDGALIRIEETGQTTWTDNLGRFRFPAVAPGRYTVSVDYLGYEGAIQIVTVEADGEAVASFQLAAGTTDVIVVRGYRSSRALALNQERTAPNSTTVLNADLLGSFNGTTISESLRRATGVAFVPDPDTGDGANVILRGLEPDLNQVTLNGLRLLDGSGIGRSPDLSGILTESIESVTINRSLLPSQDSNGAGGLVEIETKSPLDRDRRFASFGAEYGENGGDFGDEYLINGTVSGIFGENQDFGASLSVSYRERDVTRINYNVGGLNWGQYLPSGVNSPFDTNLDPRIPLPFDGGGQDVYPSRVSASEGSTQDEVFSLTASLQKQFGTHTDLRLDVSFTDQSEASYSSFTSVEALSGYVLQPVEELGGEERFSLVSENLLGPFFPGILGGVNRAASFDPSNNSSTLNLSFRGETRYSEWEVRYSAGYSVSDRDNASSYSVSFPAQASDLIFGFLNGFDADLLTAEANQNRANGLIISIFDPLRPDDDAFILPAFNDQGFAFYNDVNALPLDSLDVTPGSSGEGSELTLSGSARRTFTNDHLRYLEAGLAYRDTSFSSTRGIGQTVFYTAASGVLPSDLGFAFGPGALSRVGASGDFAALGRGSVEAVIANIEQLVDQGSLEESFAEDANVLNPRSNNGVPGGLDKTAEETLSAYVQGQIQLGRLEVIGGVRLEHVELSSTFFTGPRVSDVNGRPIDGFLEEFGGFVTDTGSQTDLLPRINANYRFNEDMILRGGYFLTVAQPQIRNLTQRQTLGLALRPRTISGFDDPVPSLRVQRGNPDLQPALTHNFGLDWEYYTDDIGVIKVSAFYKVIENALQSTRSTGDITTLPDDLVLPDIPFFNDLPDPLAVIITVPENDEDNATIWGAELTVERQFDFLPGIWSGLGVYANYAYTDSERNQRFEVVGTPDGFIEVEGIPFFAAPEHSGTFGMTYGQHGVDASLLYSYQARRLASFNRGLVNDYNEAIDSLDLRVDYIRDFNDVTMRFFLRGNDLLRGEEDPALQTSVGGEFGVPRYYTGATYFGGRSVFVGVSASF